MDGRSIVGDPATYAAMASVNSHRGRLYLLATLPRRDGTPGKAQARIPLGLADTAPNRRAAERRRQELERQLQAGTFSWANWSEREQSTTWRVAIERLRRQKVELGRTRQVTWDENYGRRLGRLPPDEAVTTASIAAAMMRYERSSSAYRELGHLLRHIAKIADVEFPELPASTYRMARPVAVPSDEEIVAWVQAAGPSAWHFGMMAAFGLRPHEIEGAVLIDRDRCQVQHGTKTGFRTVVPLPRQWVELFELRQRRERPRLAGVPDSPSAVAKWLSRETKRIGVPWRPYALRHAYAGRLWRLGGARLDLFTAARLMGHSAGQHARTYRAHVDPHQVAETAERALMGEC